MNTSPTLLDNCLTFPSRTMGLINVTTGTTDVRKSENPLIPHPAFVTEHESELSTRKIYSSTIEKSKINVSAVEAKNEAVEAKNEIAGVVTSKNETSATCTLYINEREVSIQLPISLFPNSIKFGSPINLKLINEGGVRKPLITIRKIDEKSTIKIAEEFDSLLREL